MEGSNTKICPYCKTEIKEGDAVTFCTACGIPHHTGCWEENRGCTTFGCSEQHYEARGTNPTEMCANCGAPLGDSQAFCPNCGAKKNAEMPKLCVSCGLQLRDDQEFCPNCGTKVGVQISAETNDAINAFNAGIEQKKTKKKFPLPLIIILGVVTLGIIGMIIGLSAKAKAEAIEQYREDAETFMAEVLNSGSTMEDIGNEIQKSWRAYVWSTTYNYSRSYSVDGAISAAQRYMSSEITEVKNARSRIDSLYQNLMDVPDENDPELMQIKREAKNLYEAYKNMYDCVIDPSGSYNTWTSEFGDVDTELADAYRAFKNVVE